MLADQEPLSVEFLLAFVAIVVVHLAVIILHHMEKFYLKLVTFEALFLDSSRHQVDARNDIMVQDILLQPIAEHSGKAMEVGKTSITFLRKLRVVKFSFTDFTMYQGLKNELTILKRSRKVGATRAKEIFCQIYVNQDCRIHRTNTTIFYEIGTGQEAGFLLSHNDED